jgi:ABC-type phosphate transport system auxiliary subunit
MHGDEIESHNRTLEEIGKEDQAVLARAIERNRELEEQKFQLKQKLDGARRAHADAAKKRKLGSSRL